jgi:signal transduction histidine kinase
MNFSEFNSFNAGTSLTLTFALLIALILGGNSLVIWQFRLVSGQTARLTGVNQQLLAVQQLQEQCFRFHMQLDDIARSRNASRFDTEAQPSLRALLEQTKRTRNMFTYLPPEISSDPLEAIDMTLPSQVEGMIALAKSGDWDAVSLRLSQQIQPMETRISALVAGINNEVNTRMIQAVADMGRLENRILLIVPTTMIITFLLAGFFGWSTARRIIELRMDERVQERTRIARELHDTLLQDVQGLILKLDAIAKRMPTSEPAREEIEKTLDYADRVLAEGRDRVRNLRVYSVSDNELPAAFQRIAEELSPDRTATLKTVVEGSVRELYPTIQEECFLIGREAISNALRHSEGSNIEVEIIYDPREFRLRIRDDGRGIDAEVLEKGARANHWGLQGMRERAERIGAELEVWSRVGSGTEVQLTVPAAAAYRSARTKPADSQARIPAEG